MGLGLLGRGVGDAKFLADCGASLTVTDLKTEAELKPSLKKLKGFKNIKFTLGKHELQDFISADMVIKGAGVALQSPFIKEALAHNVPVHMSTALFAKFFVEQFNGKIIGVTGTRGKSTVTHLIHHILKEAGNKVRIGGNVQGVSTLQILEDTEPNSTVVLELDSWQMQGFGYEKISPQIAVFTTFFEDHMNYYNNNMKKYLADKANIFLWQSTSDTLVLGEQAFEIILKGYKNKIKSKIIKVDAFVIPPDFKIHLPGEHNRTNVACAIKVAKVLNIKMETIKKAVISFASVSMRLELIGEKRGIKVYNDSASTTPEAAIAGLRALDSKEDKNIIIICGGFDKGLNMEEFVREAKKHAKKIVLLAGSGTEKIKDEFVGSRPYNSLKEAVVDAFESAKEGDTILFSPAFASFGMFENEYDRGNKFNKIAKEFLN